MPTCLPKIALVVATAVLVSGCESGGPPSATAGSPGSGQAWTLGDTTPDPLSVKNWVYQLQGYASERLDALAQSPHDLAVIDLARDAAEDAFRPDEIANLKASGKRVLAYFEIGSIETFRPEYATIRAQAPDLILNRWEDWPDEFFVKYWDPRWWDLAVRPRLDQALAAGFDGVYLDTPLAYEEIDLALVPGRTRNSLAAAMVALIAKISTYAKGLRQGFWVVPQNSPELRTYPGYTGAIDGIGIEELFFRATDKPCIQSWCKENLGNVRALRQAGKLVLAVDYANRPDNIRTACARYRAEGFAGYVGPVDLHRVRPPCP